MGRYQTVVYGYVARMLGDHDQADDATQEAFIAAHGAMAGFRGEHFKSWLLRIAHNKALDLIRANRRRATDSLDAEDAPEPPASNTYSPEAWAERAGLGELLRAALAELPEDQRAAVLLRESEGLSYAEIAQVMRIDLGTVKSRIARGRAGLRTYLVARRELLPTDLRLEK